LASLPLAADTITSPQTLTLNTGDSLAFTFSESSYSANAERFGASTNPSGIRFAFTTASLEGWFDFEATLRSYDGATEILFDNEGVADGYFAGTYYRGAVSVASASTKLSAEEAAAIFARPAAVLSFQNTGAAVTLGLPPYSLAQDMLVSLSGSLESGGDFSVGGQVTSVSLNRARASDSPATVDIFSPQAVRADAPEPQTWLLFSAGIGALLLMGRRRR
jgi:hypothetical protein